ncbi:hypothetical protein BCR37DRAFT_68180 [Protomyces lactucae-debilis]|uniref:SET domain-containing protein n=1 Tax=Protomyces lactucae-debilis TaxID=2754530 RepID=A0A1Y2F924_PROLT|nr:uncharacterized protein BCR37DRAFT_68180 [Protomyces lactucae-debilis]ORY80410.1 hypothetical protein BCR37DRAFT_68180 [Protomyces lactucae-debilis]
MEPAILLIDHPSFGQCAVAARDFRAGELVLNEEPACLVHYRLDPAATEAKQTLNAHQLYRRKRAFMTLNQPAIVMLYFCSYDQQKRSKLMQRFHVPHITTAAENASVAYRAALQGVRQLRQRQADLTEVANFSDQELINFSLVMTANAHELEDMTIGLLTDGAKISHACFCPNVAASTRPLRDGTSLDTAKHIALRPIAKGEVLFGSYAKLTYTPRDERIAYLMDNKLFVCQCKDCVEKEATAKVMDQTLSKAIQGDPQKAALMIDLARQLLRQEHWLHVNYAQAASILAECIDRCLQNPTNALGKAEVETLLDLAQQLDTKQTHWLKGKANPAEELLQCRLALAQACMTRAVLQHEVIPVCMDHAQRLLLLVRQVIEERRSWPIGHALEEEFDQTLFDLDDLVNGEETNGGM